MAEKIWQLQQGDDPSSIYLIDRSPTVLGRSSGCDIVISDDSVSSQHIQFTLNGKALLINELHSTNGTLLNGKPLTKAIVKPFIANKKHKLKVGDVVFDLFFDTKPQPAINEATQDATEDEPKWFYASNGQEMGPLTLQQVYEAVDSGALQPTDDFWQAGSDTRWKAFEVEGLFDGTAAAKGERPASLSMESGNIQCPYCWHRFSIEDILFISSHPELMGDPVLGDAQQRFLPSRFTAEGLALDAMGVVCPDMACPRCHMRIPASCLNLKPLIISVVGATGSGKSYFLASASWTLRTTLPKIFRVSFTDADAVTNRWLNDYEEKLFFQPDGAAFQTIAKTDLNAPSVCQQISLNDMSVLLPLPSLFTLDFNNHKSSEGQDKRRALALYDSSGEWFQAGRDSAASLVTKHMVHAEGILFLFDPTEDPRFRPILKQGFVPSKSARQDMLLVEMVERIRKYLGMASGEKLSKTIVLGISKADLLEHLLPLEENPWHIPPGGNTAVLDFNAIHRMSRKTRELMEQHAPEIVGTLEAFAENIVYMPNSALGHNPAEKGVRPCDIKPKWVDVPFMYILAQRGHLAFTEQGKHGETKM